MACMGWEEMRVKEGLQQRFLSSEPDILKAATAPPHFSVFSYTI